MERLELQSIANEVRKSIIVETHAAKSGHPGGSLSCADMITYLYFEEMNVDPKNPDNPDRDRFVLSKGHSAPALYAVLAERGFITIAFDPSFTGESGGNVRYMASPDINTEDFMAAVDFLSLNDKVDPDRISIIGICGWGGMAINAAALDTRIKATVASTMYDMTRVNANGYFDSEDSEEARYEKKAAMCAQRLEDLKNGEYKLGGGVVDPLPDDAPFFVKDYYDYYKTDRGYHPRSLNSNGGWNVIGCESFVNQPILKYSNEIRSAVLIVHGEKAHSCYFGKDAYANMVKDSKYTDNKELFLIPDAVHTDLYDGGGKDAIPYDKIEDFIRKYI